MDREDINGEVERMLRVVQVDKPPNKADFFAGLLKDYIEENLQDELPWLSLEIYIEDNVVKLNLQTFGYGVQREFSGEKLDRMTLKQVRIHSVLSGRRIVEQTLAKAVIEDLDWDEEE